MPVPPWLSIVAPWRRVGPRPDNPAGASRPPGSRELLREMIGRTSHGWPTSVASGGNPHDPALFATTELDKLVRLRGAAFVSR